MVFFLSRGLLGPSGTSAGDIDVGTEVILNENGSPVNYLVVNQGIPENSPLYDASCEGTWLLRKDIPFLRAWGDGYNDYAASYINEYLNGDWLNVYSDRVAQSIKQVKIPYVNGRGGSPIASGTDGLSVKVFLLGSCELGWTSATYETIPNDGATLSYFQGLPERDAKRVSNYNGSPQIYRLRSEVSNNIFNAVIVDVNGGWNVTYGTFSDDRGFRPALILPYNFKFQDAQIAA